MFMPYISVNIETTGLAHQEKSDILEIAMIFDDIGYHGGIKETLHLYIDHDPKKLTFYGDNLSLHQELLQKIEDAKKEQSAAGLEDRTIVSYAEARDKISSFYQRAVELCDNKAPSFAGKYMGQLIIPLLHKFGLITEEMCHRNLDVPSLYFTQFEFVPTIYQIAKAMGIECPEDCLGKAQAIGDMVNRAIDKKLGGGNF